MGVETIIAIGVAAAASAAAAQQSHASQVHAGQQARDQETAVNKEISSQKDQQAQEAANLENTQRSARQTQLKSLAAAQGMGSTNLTGPQGVTQPAPTAQKTLLGM